MLSRTFKKGDKVEVNLPIQVWKGLANNNVVAERGKVALLYGPLIYCAEWADNNGKTSNIMVMYPQKLNSPHSLNQVAKWCNDLTGISSCN